MDTTALRSAMTFAHDKPPTEYGEKDVADFTCM